MPGLPPQPASPIAPGDLLRSQGSLASPLRYGAKLPDRTCGGRVELKLKAGPWSIVRAVGCVAAQRRMSWRCSGRRWPRGSRYSGVPSNWPS